MPKEYFKLSDASGLNQIPEGSRIHVSGVCGVAMAQLAIELARRGYRVSGSDKEFYEPMGSLLRGSAIELRNGYSPGNIPSDVELVVIGNALSYDNPEVQEVERRKLRYSLFPKILHDLAIEGRHSIVVSGTHGKSTTSALLSWLLSRLGLDPSYFVGAVIPELSASLRVGSGIYAVTEGDEYDSAFFAKVPKFSFYRPDTLIVTAIEYDHADIYPNLESIEEQFTRLVSGLPAQAKVICCIDDINVARLLTSWRKEARCSFITYGANPAADFRVLSNESSGRSQSVTIDGGSAGRTSFKLSIPGRHNALNATAVYIACQVNGLDVSKIQRIFPEFVGARRRQEVRYDHGITLIDDFAHHPTAVRETISAIRSFYPGRRLWAVFEPRSNTSRRKVFQSEYIAAFLGADEVVLCDVAARANDDGQELIQVSDLADGISAQGIRARVFPDANAIRGFLLAEVTPGDVILVMSNGGFGGLVAALESGLKEKVIPATSP